LIEELISDDGLGIFTFILKNIIHRQVILLFLNLTLTTQISVVDKIGQNRRKFGYYIKWVEFWKFGGNFSP
jgi:hypothetical protein